jgi:hypothetical protein
VKLFWWSPRRDPRAARAELRANAGTWIRLRANGGRLLSNFGDEMSPLLFRALGYRVTWAPLSSADVTGVGSLLDLYLWARQPTTAVVWGSGLRAASTAQAREVIRRSVGTFAAVRGPRTRDALGLPVNTPLGDPGLLAPALLDGKTSRRGTHAVVIPHFRTWSHGASRSQLKALTSLGYRVVAPNQDPVDVVQAISNSAIVYTSSLHGLIVADALGVPAALVRFANSELSREPEFKYLDYFESVQSSPRWIAVDDIISPRAALLHQIEAESETRQGCAAALRPGLEASSRALASVV